MRDAIIAANECDWNGLVAKCLAAPPAGKRIFYQKHMTHHMLDGFGRDWIGRVTNAFLIRAPEAVLASYTEKRADVTVGCLEMPRSESSGFGVMHVDDDNIIKSFLEKPADPPGICSSSVRGRADSPNADATSSTSTACRTDPAA